ELPLVSVSKQAPLDQLPAIRIRGEGERAKLVGNELVGTAGGRLLTVQEQQLLKVEVPDRSAKRVEQRQQLPLAFEQRCGRRLRGSSLHRAAARSTGDPFNETTVPALKGSDNFTDPTSSSCEHDFSLPEAAPTGAPSTAATGSSGAACSTRCRAARASA